MDSESVIFSPSGKYYHFYSLSLVTIILNNLWILCWCHRFLWIFFVLMVFLVKHLSVRLLKVGAMNVM